MIILFDMIFGIIWDENKDDLIWLLYKRGGLIWSNFVEITFRGSLGVTIPHRASKVHRVRVALAV